MPQQRTRVVGLLAGVLAWVHVLAAAADDAIGPVPAAPPAVVEVRIDASAVVGTSNLKIGVTETHLSADHKDAKPAAVARGMALLDGVSAFENTHILGWGVGPPMSAPGVYTWASLDRRIAFLREQKTPIVITLCSAPGFMKESGKDWDLGSAILPEQEDHFAALCVEVAKRYPDVRYFQVWNEFKGYWNKTTNKWDVERYTRMYNKVYDALKGHDPKLQVGGLYLVIAGSGSAAWGYTGTDVQQPLSESDKQIVTYWSQHRHGADFVCVDREIHSYHDTNDYSVDQLMTLTPTYERATRQAAEIAGLPVWWSEFYAFGNKLPREVVGAAYASCYIHAIKGGAAVALIWNPNQGELGGYLYTDVRKPDGGRPTPCYQAFAAVAKWFTRGTRLVAAESTSPWVEVLASDKGAVLLVNKWSKSVTVMLSAKVFEIKAYEIKVIEPGTS